jgi:ABC-type lipoprotein export system ATPase subunit
MDSAHLRLSKIAVFLPGASQPLFRIPRLEVAAGKPLLIHGPSGRGKTTLLHLMAGLCLPSEGDVFVGEDNLRFLSDERRCDLRREKFGIIFQRLNLLDHLTPLENTLLTAPPHTKPEQAREILQRLGLAHCTDSRTAFLSLGEQQRCAVARVLVARPRIVLADEPTSSLDAANTDTVIQALLQLPESPTLVIVSHDARIRGLFPRRLTFEELCA